MTESLSDVQEDANPRADTRSWLRALLLHECEVMATHALSSGMQVPDLVVRALAIAPAPEVPGKALVPAATGSDWQSGSQQPGEYTPQQPWSDDCLRQLALAHNRLVELVAPATPRTIQYLNTHIHRPSLLGFLGKVPFVHRAMVVAMVFLLGLVVLRVVPHMHTLLAAGDPVSVSTSRWLLLLEELYYMAAAGMGASFAVLFEVNRYTLKAAFDPIYEPFYWIRFALGLIAGVLLAELVPTDPSHSVYHGVAKPTLALLGGFSASVVYRLLVHLRNTIASFIPSGSNEASDPQGQPAGQERPDLSGADRLKIVAGLIALQQRLGSGAPPAHLQADIDHLLAEFMSTRL
jgi:hypothetical protein